MNHRTAYGLLLSSAALCAQGDILYYRFDDAYGSKAVNYAAVAPTPMQGTLASNLASPWVPGRFGSALASGGIVSTSYNRVDTGWVPSHTGSFSFALWLKAAPTPPTSIWYAFGVPVSFALRFYSVGTTGTLSTVGFTGATSVYANTTAVVYPMTVGNWVHVAFVVDATAMTYTYYINGVAEVPKTLTAAPSIVYPASLTVGQQLTSSAGSPFDIDEFYLVGYALQATEVAALVARSRAASAPYEGGCGGLTLASIGGRPVTGNATYQLTLTSANAGAFTIGIGSNRASLGGIPLPFDLGTVVGGLGVCPVDSSLDVVTIAGGKPPGTANIALPIPANPVLDGLTLYLQTLAVGGVGPLQLSNPFALGIGG